MTAIRQANMSEAAREKLIRDCLARAPYETCGILLGTIENDRLYADEHRLVRNASAEPFATFRFDPADWVRVYYDAQKNQRSIVGIFHSHPQGSPTPSALDRAGWDGWATYWIVSLADGHANVHVFGRTPWNEWTKIATNPKPR
ncbi:MULTISPECIES: Mov34/MPN/PAD-1 family protein [Cohnella]|uniref:Mov34/MPN/PAD-1 family protein n=1 Tax=Cohnella TaxID=329857 RepID=UPI0009B965D5|nr:MULTISPECIES: M67 family metallopeptidase [Cohnella]MBN2984778.1 M67 family metallopeptidase [Cohnella algarum]